MSDKAGKHRFQILVFTILAITAAFAVLFFYDYHKAMNPPEKQLILSIQNALFNYYIDNAKTMPQPRYGAFDWDILDNLLSKEDIAKAESSGWLLLPCSSTDDSYVIRPMGDFICVKMNIPLRTACVIEKIMDDANFQSGIGRIMGASGNENAIPLNCRLLPDTIIAYIYHLL